MQNLEIERKYLIVLPDEEFLKSREGCVVKHITQTYLLRHENDVERRKILSTSTPKNARKAPPQGLRTSGI